MKNSAYPTSLSIGWPFKEMPFKEITGRLLICVFGWFTSLNEGIHAAEMIDFKSEIQPIIESACLNCHCEENTEGGLRLDSLKAALEGGDNGPALVPGDPSKSSLFQLTILASDHDEIMPPESPLDKSLTAKLKKWIEQGAKWPADATLKMQPRIDFGKHVQPILESNCISCHNAKNAEGGLDLSTEAMALSTGDSDSSLIPFDPDESLIYTFTTVDKDADELMPPKNSGGPLGKTSIDRLRLWILQGAVWPDELKLVAKARVQGKIQTPDNLDLIKKIHDLVVKTSQEKSEAEMAAYSSKVPRTGAVFHMVAIPGGEFLMGSPADEADRSEVEGPQTKVKVAPFWMGRCEVTWDEYEPFMITQVPRKKHGARADFDPSVHTIVDAVSQPTGPYTEMSFGMGQEGYPAISMTQHAASKYCQWLSAQTGHFYRLATEAEWEYACRAGTTTPYSFGDVSKIDQYAWYYENSNEKYQKVGKKKPNPWGLYDMHGNVMEWTIDQFTSDYFTRIKESTVNPWIRPDRLYPRSVRGGNWDDDADKLRSAIRRGSDPSWKQSDPQLPKSIWYHTNAQWLGFRIVRPLNVPSIEEMNFYWNSASNKIR